MRPDTKLYPVLSVEEALGQGLAAFTPLPPERVPVLEAQGLAIIPEHVDHLAAGARVKVLLLE